MKKVFLLFFAWFICNNINAQNGCDLQEACYLPLLNCEDYEHGDWIMVFEDEFDGNQLNSDVWNSLIEGWLQVHDQELQFYKTDNIVIQNGILHLEARDEPDIYNYYDYALDTNEIIYTSGFYQYTSGWIETKKRFLYGKIEARCKIPEGQGLWPAFWLFGNGYEIDIFEFACQDPDECLFNVHNWENNGHFSCPDSYVENLPFSDDYHIYSVEWDDFFLIYSIDGVEKRRIARYTDWYDHIIKDCKGLPEGDYVFDKSVFPRRPMPIILNLAISNNQCGNPPNSMTVFPSSLDIDYVRVYERTNPNRRTILSDQSDQYDSSLACYTSGRINMEGVDSTFAIKSGDRLSLFATNEIEIEAETEIHYGAEVEMSIVSAPSYMSDGFDDTMSEPIDTIAIIQPIDQEQSPETSFSISPNPTTGFFSLEINGNWSEYHRLRIVNGMGETVFSINVGDRALYSIHPRLPKGIYSVILEGPSKEQTKTLIIQ